MSSSRRRLTNMRVLYGAPPQVREDHTLKESVDRFLGSVGKENEDPDPVGTDPVPSPHTDDSAFSACVELLWSLPPAMRERIIQRVREHFERERDGS